MEINLKINAYLRMKLFRYKQIVKYVYKYLPES